MDYVENICFYVNLKWSKTKSQQILYLKLHGILLFIELTLKTLKKMDKTQLF